MWKSERFCVEVEGSCCDGDVTFAWKMKDELWKLELQFYSDEIMIYV